MTHLFVSIPLASLLASSVWARWTPHPFAFVLCAAFSLSLPSVLVLVSWTLNQTHSGFLLRCIIRCCISVALVFGWMATIPYKIIWIPRRAWTWTLLLCTVLPSIYAWKQSEICRDEFDVSLAGTQIARASRALDRWIDIASPKRYQGIATEDWQRKLKREIAQIERNLIDTNSKHTNLNDHLNRAMQLLSLSRDAEAEQVLLNSKSADQQVLLLLAISARELKNFEKTVFLCRKMLAETSPMVKTGNPLIFQLLGESLVGQRKIRTAMETYELAILQCEPERGEFEMRLGTLLGETGDAASAIEHFERASSVNSRLEQEAKNRIRGLRGNSCRF